MITDAIIDFFLESLNYIFEHFKLPDVFNIVIPDGAYDTILEILRPLGYFFPMNIILACLAVSVSIDSFHIIWSLILRIKSFLSVHIFS